MAINYNAMQAAGIFIPVGVFEGVITHSEEITSRSSGRPMLRLQIWVGENYDRILHYALLTPSTMSDLKAFLDSVGGYDTSKDFSFEAGDLLGKRVKIRTVRNGEFNGRPRVRIDRWIPAGE